MNLILNLVLGFFKEPIPMDYQNDKDFIQQTIADVDSGKIIEL